MPPPERKPPPNVAAPGSGTRKRAKLDPDAAVQLKLVAVASDLVKEGGVNALTVADVLDRAKLGTRAFYRHFSSKDQLVQAVFLDMAHVEMRRLRQRMASAAGPLEAVAAWIEGRLDLAFDDAIRSDLRALSLDAQSQMFAAPELVNLAYRELMKPLVDQITRGKEIGAFPIADPLVSSDLVQGAVWACLERQWSTGDSDRTQAREAALRFCLGGLGAPAGPIAAIVGQL